MNIKTKLILGVGFLFMSILLLSFVSIKSIWEIKVDTDNILTIIIEPWSIAEIC